MDGRQSCPRIGLLAARAFRLGRRAEGNERFVGFVDALQSLLDRSPSTRRIDALGSLLARLEAALERGDDLCVADLLEFELAPLIRSEGSESSPGRTAPSR